MIAVEVFRLLGTKGYARHCGLSARLLMDVLQSTANTTQASKSFTSEESSLIEALLYHMSFDEAESDATGSAQTT